MTYAESHDDLAAMGSLATNAFNAAGEALRECERQGVPPPAYWTPGDATAWVTGVWRGPHPESPSVRVGLLPCGSCRYPGGGRGQVIVRPATEAVAWLKGRLAR